MSACCKTYWTSNKWRNISATFCYSVTLVLTLMMLIATSTNVNKQISWTNLEYDYKFWIIYPGREKDLTAEKHSVNIGLLTSWHCWYMDRYPEFDSGCENIQTPSVTDSNDLANAGRGVITANVFGMLFAIISFLLMQIYIYTPNFAAKLRFPRIIMFISNFLMLMMFIVSVASWFRLANDKFASSIITKWFPENIDPDTGKADPKWIPTIIKEVTTGYAVAVNIFIIALSFFAWMFAFLRVQFPNRAEGEAKSVEGVGMMSETGHAISMQYQPPAINMSPSNAMAAYDAYHSSTSPPPQKRGFFG